MFKGFASSSPSPSLRSGSCAGPDGSVGPCPLVAGSCPGRFCDPEESVGSETGLVSTLALLVGTVDLLKVFELTTDGPGAIGVGVGSNSGRLYPAHAWSGPREVRPPPTLTPKVSPY